MATPKIAINGFGRIGRKVLRLALERNDVEVVGINDLSKPETIAHLFKYDSIFGSYKGEVKSENSHVVIDGKKIRVFSEKEPARIPAIGTP